METTGSTEGQTRGDSRRKRPQPRSYLLKADYRELGLSDLPLDDKAAQDLLEKARWGALGENKQACTRCGSIASHYRYKDRMIWKCRDLMCSRQFSLLGGTRLHSLKIAPAQLLGILFHFVEAKDSISAREISGLYNLHYQTAHTVLMKIREALRETQLAEPKLRGRIQADAAYFIRYRRPGNVGTGRALKEKADQKNAGVDELGKAAQTEHAKDMHALVMFVQTGPQKERQYKIAMVKTEEQADVEGLADQFCERGSTIWTDQMNKYFVLAQTWEHAYVNHSKQFKNKESVHTNFAENFFSRVRASQWGAWHRLTVQHLIEYAWEVAWRLTMAGHSNGAQFRDLLRRLLTSNRGTRFVRDRTESPEAGETVAEEKGFVVEIPKADLAARRGRPKAGVKRGTAPREKRSYKKKIKSGDGQAATQTSNGNGSGTDTPTLSCQPILDADS
jgi:ISXO2-like transposase domain/Transposase zinc-ribbon domain